MSEGRSIRTSDVPPGGEGEHAPAPAETSPTGARTGAEPPDVDSLMSRLDEAATERAADADKRPSAAELLGGRGKRTRRTIRVPDDAVPAATPPPTQVRRSTPPPAPAAMRAPSVPPPAISASANAAAAPSPGIAALDRDTPIVLAAALPQIAPPAPPMSEPPPPSPSMPSPDVVRITPTRMISVGETRKKSVPPPALGTSPAFSVDMRPPPTFDPPSTPISPPSEPAPTVPAVPVASAARSADPDATQPNLRRPTVPNLDATVREALAMLDREDFESPGDIDISVADGEEEPTAPSLPRVNREGPTGERISAIPNSEESIDEVEEVVPSPSQKDKGKKPPPRKSMPGPLPGMAASSDPSFSAIKPFTSPAAATTLPSAKITEVAESLTRYSTWTAESVG